MHAVETENVTTVNAQITANCLLKACEFSFACFFGTKIHPILTVLSSTKQWNKTSRSRFDALFIHTDWALIRRLKQ